MADNRRGEGKEIRKDDMARREVLDDIASETVNQGGQEAHYRNPNRDQSRGDWDRSRRHTDEGMSRAEEQE